MKIALLLFALFAGFCLACKGPHNTRPEVAARQQMLAAAPTTTTTAAPQAITIL